jgi:hypothetical protein
LSASGQATCAFRLRAHPEMHYLRKQVRGETGTPAWEV